MSSNVATLARPGQAVSLTGISHVALLVSDPETAGAFYRDTLGFRLVGSDMLPECGRHVVVAAASGQLIALCQGNKDPGLVETGIHQAYRVSPEVRDELLTRLSAQGVAVHRYKEDRLAEDADNLYFYDPFGNRLQLVTRSDAAPGGSTLIAAIDHAAVQAIDVEWQEKFYIRHLGLPVDHLAGARTADFARARAWGEGNDPMAPGCRRWDKRYTAYHGTDPVPRPNVQLFAKAGDSVFGVFLAVDHFQDPPEDQVIGLPRTAFAVPASDIDNLAEVLRDWGPTVGPVEHPKRSPRARSLYFKDPGANFIEFCC